MFTRAKSAYYVWWSAWPRIASFKISTALGLSLGAVFRWSRRDAAPIVAHRINPTLQARRYRLPITMAWTLITPGLKQFRAKEELIELQGSVTEVLTDSPLDRMIVG